jgi:predicted metal-dependent TIM-barrel fold hydrolase
MLFDPHLHAEGLRPRDLEDLRFFGVGGALTTADDAPTPATAAAIREYWDELTGPTLRKMRKAGLAAYASVGIHPRRIPWRGLEALLHDLPAILGRPGVVAMGEVGLEEGSEREEQVLIAQLKLAHELRLPVLVHTPQKDKTRITRRLLNMLKEAELEPSRVVVDHADDRTVRMIRACGFLAGLSLSGQGRLGGRDPLDEAVRLVGALGPEGLILGSDAGDGAADLLALPRVVDRLTKAGLSGGVVARVCGGNAAGWLGIDLSEARGASGRSARPTSP